MKYAIIAVSLLATPTTFALSQPLVQGPPGPQGPHLTIGSIFDTGDDYPPLYNRSYQVPNNSYQQKEPPRYDNEYYRSRGAVGPSIGDRFGNHLDSGWGGR